jgi:hypothetical protein
MRSGRISESPLLDAILFACGEMMQDVRCVGERAESQTKDRWQEYQAKRQDDGQGSTTATKNDDIAREGCR